MKRYLISSLLAVLFFSGCASVDPKTVDTVDATEKQLAPRSVARIDAEATAVDKDANLTPDQKAAKKGALDSEKKLWKSLEDLIRSLKDAVK